MAVCLYVLEPCPFKCESYVQRNKKQQHMKLCRNNFMRSMPKLYDDNSSESTSSMPMANRIIRTLGKFLPSFKMISVKDVVGWYTFTKSSNYSACLLLSVR